MENNVQTGVVSYLNTEKGYAYIRGQDGKDYAVKESEYKKINDPVFVLKKGRHVQFIPSEWKGRLYAKSVNMVMLSAAEAMGISRQDLGIDFALKDMNDGEPDDGLCLMDFGSRKVKYPFYAWNLKFRKDFKSGGIPCHYFKEIESEIDDDGYIVCFYPDDKDGVYYFGNVSLLKKMALEQYDKDHNAILPASFLGMYAGNVQENGAGLHEFANRDYRNMVYGRSRTYLAELIKIEMLIDNYGLLPKIRSLHPDYYTGITPTIHNKYSGFWLNNNDEKVLLLICGKSTDDAYFKVSNTGDWHGASYYSHLIVYYVSDDIFRAGTFIGIMEDVPHSDTQICYQASQIGPKTDPGTLFTSLDDALDFFKRR